MRRHRGIKNINHRKKIVTYIIVILLLFCFIIPFYKDFFNRIIPKENVTTKLNNDTDFLNWFIDFDKLYKKKVTFINYSLKKDAFETVNKLLNEENKDMKDVYFKNGIYYINNNETLELDTTTRSLRYIKYKNNKIKEILEVRLLNGHYYVIIAKDKYTYKIIFNNNSIKKKKLVNKNDSISIKNSIYKVNEFIWKEK